jgi:hypothetical protein
MGLSQCGQWYLQGINVTGNKLDQIVKDQYINGECQGSLEGQCGTEVVRYIQRPWEIHIDRGRGRIERGMVRKQTDVPLQMLYCRECFTLLCT